MTTFQLSTMTSHQVKSPWTKMLPKVTCVFPQQSKTFLLHFCSSSLKGTIVASFKAYGRRSEAVHYAVSGGALGGHFDVDLVSGNLFVNSTLDYETVKRYEVWVSAFYSTKPLYSVAKVSQKYLKDSANQISSKGNAKQILPKSHGEA